MVALRQPEIMARLRPLAVLAGPAVALGLFDQRPGALQEFPAPVVHLLPRFRGEIVDAVVRVEVAFLFNIVVGRTPECGFDVGFKEVFGVGFHDATPTRSAFTTVAAKPWIASVYLHGEPPGVRAPLGAMLIWPVASKLSSTACRISFWSEGLFRLK